MTINEQAKISWKKGVMEFFKHVALAPPDPIFGLMEAFKKDKRERKVNLGIGIYKDAVQSTPKMEAVREAERLLLDKERDKVYLPIEGNQSYLDFAGKLFFGDAFWEEKHEQICALQSIGGTGALRLGADFLFKVGFTMLHLPDPTWANHQKIFAQIGLAISSYPYFDKRSNELLFEEMIAYLMNEQRKGVVLFHACCHNPSGVDLTLKQWEEMAKLCREKELFPFFDCAYLGFGDGLEEDALPFRLFAEKGLEFFLALSFSKIFSLYGERVGGLYYFSSTPETAMRVKSVLKTLVRGSYSTPPHHGAAIVGEVLGAPSLRKMWEGELKGMRQRIEVMREAFVKALSERSQTEDFSLLLGKKGIFSFTGLHPKQVDRLIVEHGIYMTQDGRINLSGLTEDNLEFVVDAITHVRK